MPTHTVGIVGTGADPGEATNEGYAMAYRHADAYEEIENCELVACADIVPENAAAFADEYGLGDEGVYDSAAAMLEGAAPDVVSVCVPPAAHAEVVVTCARSGVVDAVHCEKPMALTWGGARLMAQECDRRDVQLTFNHQRRFGGQFRRAKELLDAGEIGDLERVECTGANVYDYGTHSIDLCNYYADQSPPAWVLAAIDYRERDVWFGAHNENQAVVFWAYESGVHGFAATGDHGTDAVGAHNRLVGTEGVIEVAPSDGPDLVLRRGGDRAAIEVDDDGNAYDYVTRAIRDAVGALDAGEESELRARNALDVTEIVFGAYESVRRRGRVEFPLTVEDNPLEAMVEDGTFDVSEK